MDINQLEVLLTVAQERSFSRAAEVLHRTQPAISQAVRRLEQEVGETLFDRSSKDGTLTEAGKVLLEHAQQMLNMRRNAFSAVRELKDMQRGKVTISANEHTVLYLLPILEAFHARHPHIKIEIKRSLASRIPSEIIGRDVEIGVVSYKPTDTGIKAQPAMADEIALVVAPEHPLAKRETVSIRELGAEPFLAHNVASPYRDLVVKTFEKYRTPLNITMELPTMESIKRLVEKGVGVALVPRLSVQAELDRKQLIGLTVKEMRSERSLYLVYRRNATLSHAARAFLKTAKESGK